MVRTACVTLLLVSLASWGCASGQGQGAAAERGEADMAAVPSGSPLAEITLGMNDSDVRKILGEPTTQNAYMTGKSWVPFYYGPDTSRTDYVYDGIGRVVFSRSRYSGQLKVIDVRHNPDERAR